MATPRVDRRLAAILAADVVGYSRLMDHDEAGTLERLKAHRKEFIQPLLAEHHGRIVKLMGDGVLCEFGSVVDAVACAVAIQRGVAGARGAAHARYSNAIQAIAMTGVLIRDNSASVPLPRRVLGSRIRKVPEDVAPASSHARTRPRPCPTS